MCIGEGEVIEDEASIGEITETKCAEAKELETEER